MWSRNTGIGEPWYNAQRPLARDVIDGQGRVLSRMFFGTGSAEDAHAISLDRAESWLLDQQQRNRAAMLLLAHERPRSDWAETQKTGRVYEVVDSELFFRRYAQRRRTSMMSDEAAMQPAAGFDRFVCELLTGPCKLYFDLEFARATNVGLDGEALQAKVLETCQAALHSGAGFIDDAQAAAAAWQPVRFTDVVVLDSSKASKFSRHVIVTLDDGRTAFASPKAVGRFVRDCIGNEAFAVAAAAGGTVPFADPSVYSGRQPFRLYGAAKYNEPNRLMVPQNGPTGPWTTWDPDAVFLQRSLVTGTAALATRMLQYGVAEDRKRPRPLATGTRPAAAMRHRTMLPEVLVQGIMAVPDIAAAEPIECRYMCDTATVFVHCRSRECALAGREHHSSTVYGHVDLLRARFRMRCHSPSCKDTPAPRWTPLIGPVAEAIDAFLAEIWRPQRIGAEASALLLS